MHAEIQIAFSDAAMAAVAERGDGSGLTTQQIGGAVASLINDQLLAPEAAGEILANLYTPEKWSDATCRMIVYMATVTIPLERPS